MNDNDTNIESEEAIFFCYFCGAPEPCRENACIQAAMALADYYDEEQKRKGPVN